MKKYFGILFGFSFLVFPAISFAGNQVQLIDADPLGNNFVQCANITDNLRYGSHDIDNQTNVYILQDFLNVNGYLKVSPNGFFGRATLNAVKEFQNKNGISPSGFVGPITISKIKSIDCSKDNTPSALPDVTVNTTIASTSAVSNNANMNLSGAMFGPSLGADFIPTISFGKPDSTTSSSTSSTGTQTANSIKNANSNAAAHMLSGNLLNQNTIVPDNISTTPSSSVNMGIPGYSNSYSPK